MAPERCLVRDDTVHHERWVYPEFAYSTSLLLFQMIQLLGRDSKRGFFCRNQNHPKLRTSTHIRDGGKELAGE
jgi:hypothetical protein